METVGFTITPEDLLAAQRLHHTVCLKRRWFLIRIVLSAGALGLIFAMLPPSGGSNRIMYGLAAAAIYTAVMGLTVALNRIVFLPFNSRRQFSQRKDFGGALSYAVEPSHIAVTSKNGFSKVPTEDFVRWTENSKTILLYQSDNMFNFVPKRAINDAFHRALIDELARAGVPTASF